MSGKTKVHISTGGLNDDRDNGGSPFLPLLRWQSKY